MLDVTALDAPLRRDDRGGRGVVGGRLQTRPAAGSSSGVGGHGEAALHIDEQAEDKAVLTPLNRPLKLEEPFLAAAGDETSRSTRTTL